MFELIIPIFWQIHVEPLNSGLCSLIFVVHETLVLGVCKT